MARKSRKITAAAEPVIEVQPTETFPTAIYARLSVENSGKSEKVDVIANQIEICKSYIADRPYLDLIDTYIDNGHTGTVFDRPEFNRLINDIKTGRIKCLVVRDLSRFGRDYIETGTYLERIFPQIGLRFIAIKENYDSFDTDGSSESLMIPLQNMINALYSKDISRKVSTALKAQMEDGTFVKRNLPYGYKWDEEHSNMVIDEEAAQYVRLIFRWKLEGKSNVYILDTLESMGAPTPEYQKRVNGTRKGDGYSRNGWNRSTLPEILTNPHYVGDTVLGRSLRALYKGVRPHKIKDKDQWIVFPNTHEAIISREDFEKVQDILEAASAERQAKMEKSEEIRSTLINLFEGKIVCADCGRKMYFHKKRIDKDKRGRWYAFYECSTAVSRRHQHCTPHYTRQDTLEADVLAAIQLQVKAALDYAAYSKDLSVKTTSAKVQMMKQGKYVGGYAPYGYMMHPTKRNALAVDPDSAAVVRRIFDEALAGNNTSVIADMLNDEKVPTPGQYFRSKYPDNKKFLRMSEKISWTTSMVHKVLVNQLYTGAMVSHKRKSCGVGNRRTVANDPIIVEGTHEAIVSKEEFEEAQKVIRGGIKNPDRKVKEYPLRGLICCGNCKRAMYRGKTRNDGIFFTCTHSTHDKDTDCAVGEKYSEAWLESIVFHAIGDYLALAEKQAVQNREVGYLRKSAITECAAKIRSLQTQTEQLKGVKLRLYEKYTSSSITKQEYLKQKSDTDAKLAENAEAIRFAEERMRELDSEQPCSDERLDAVCNEYRNSSALTYELAHAFISAVYVHNQDNIEIVWKFKDFLSETEAE